MRGNLSVGCVGARGDVAAAGHLTSLSRKLLPNQRTTLRGVAWHEAICQLGAGVRGLRQTISDALRSLRDVFRNPALRRIQLAFATSIIGDWAYAVAVAVYAYDHGGATAVGVLGVARYVSLAI